MGVISIPTDQIEVFANAVRAASGSLMVRNAVANVYQALGDAIDLRRPICESSGKCCRFDEYGHRLFITTMELAAFVGQLEERLGKAGELLPQNVSNGCPFQIGRLCGVHGIRPFGCRVFFCDPAAVSWQNEQYERFHAELKRLHEELAIPYFYVEWRAALGAVKLLASPVDLHVV